MSIVTVSVIMVTVIKTYACKQTKLLYENNIAGGFLKNIAKRAIRKLDMLNFASRIDDLGAIPGARLEALRGKRKGQWSIRVNNQYRICFRFEAGNAFDVEIIDYH